jgi:anhydro-N-acetylmuramic acid kinase
LHKDYDDNGSWARKGELDAGLLGRLLDDPYFRLPAPKSTGLEHFNMNWLNKAFADECLKPVDVQTTLAELTALTAANSLADFTQPERLLVCGGGAHNAYLMRRIAAALPDTVVESTARYGAEPDWVEGLLFAWLARERLNESVQDTRPVTGADRPVLLGDIHEP